MNENDAVCWFTPLRTFAWPELGSEYVRGLSYALAPDNAPLAEALAQWEREGWVRVSHSRAGIGGAGRVGGRGAVGG